MADIASYAEPSAIARLRLVSYYPIGLANKRDPPHRPITTTLILLNSSTNTVLNGSSKRN